MLAGRDNGPPKGSRAHRVLPVTLQVHVHLACPEARCARKVRVGTTRPALVVRALRLEAQQEPSSGPRSCYLWLQSWLVFCKGQRRSAPGNHSQAPKHLQGSTWRPQQRWLSSAVALILAPSGELRGHPCLFLLGRGPATFWLSPFLFCIRIWIAGF